MDHGLQALQEAGRLFLALPDGAGSDADGSPVPLAASKSNTFPAEGSGAAVAPSHVPHPHENVLNYANPSLFRPGGADERPLYTEYLPDTPLDELQRATSLFFLLGAADTPAFRQLSSDSGVMLLVVEPDVERLSAFVRAVGAERLLEGNVFLLGGNVLALRDRLDEILSKELFGFGFPAFLSQPGRDWCESGASGAPQLVELVEAVYYRRILYPLSGHDFIKNRPFRNIRKGLYFDAQKHLYENVPLYCRHGAFTMLKDRFAGCEAIIVATGPELDQRLDYIRENQRKAVVIAVNNALETLVKNGIESHFAVCVDNSVLIENSYAALPRLSRTILVTHCFSTVPEGVFPGMLFFGNLHSEAFPSIPSLKWHGSVLTACHFLAGFMGCVKCVYVGAQLSSPHPFQLEYSEATYHARHNGDDSAATPTGRFPQLYPVRSVSGQQVYTSLNFLDVALWLGAEIDRLGLPVVNTSRLSILRGEKVSYDPDYQVPAGCDADAVHADIDTAIRFPRTELTRQYLQGEVARWREVRKACDAALKAADVFAMGDRLFAHFEQDNTSYLVQRFGSFDNAAFHAGYIASTETASTETAGTDAARREAALRDYLANVRDMAAQFVGILARSLAALP